MAALDATKSLPSLADVSAKQRSSSSPRKRLSAVDISLPAPIPEGKLSEVFRGKLQLPSQMTSPEELESFMRQSVKKESEGPTFRGLYATIRRPGAGKNGNTSKSGRSVSMPTDQVTTSLSALDLHMRKCESSQDQDPDQVSGSCPSLSEENEVDAGLKPNRLSSLFSDSIPSMPRIPSIPGIHQTVRRLSSSNSSGSGSLTPQSRRSSLHSTTSPSLPTLAGFQAGTPNPAAAKKVSLLDLEKHLTVMEFLEEGPPSAKISPASSKENSRRGSMSEFQTVRFAGAPTSIHAPSWTSVNDDNQMEICEFLSSQPPTPSMETPRKITPTSGGFTLPASPDDASGLGQSPKPHKRAVSAATLPLVKLMSVSPTTRKRLSNPSVAVYATAATTNATSGVTNNNAQPSSFSPHAEEEFFSLQARKPESTHAVSAGPIIQSKDSASNIFGGDLPPIATPIKIAEAVSVCSTPAAQPVTKLATATAAAPTPMPSSPRMVAPDSAYRPCIVTEASSSLHAEILGDIPKAIIHETEAQAASRKKRLGHRRARSGSVDGPHVSEHVATGITQLAKRLVDLNSEIDQSNLQNRLKSSSLPDFAIQRESPRKDGVISGPVVVRLEKDIVWTRVDDAASLLAMPEAQTELATLRTHCDVHTVWPQYLQVVNINPKEHQAQARARINRLKHEIADLKKALESRQGPSL